MPRNLLDKLADEVVLEILNHLDEGIDMRNEEQPASSLNKSIQAISRANRRLRRISLPLLYRRVTLSTIPHHEAFLELLIGSSYHRGLVRSVWLGWTDHTLMDTQSDTDSETGSTMITDGDDNLSIQDMSRLFKDVQMNPLPDGLISDIQETETWVKALLSLHLLHRLEELRVSFSTPQFDGMLSKIMQRQLLSPKLRVIGRTAVQGTVEPDILVPAFLYPSVTEIHGNRIVSSELELHCDWLLPQDTSLSSMYGTSNVERIELHLSRLDTDVIDELLQLPRALKTLVYSDAGTEYERMKLSFWEVLMHTSDSLENLSVRWKETGGFIENDYMWTLHSFSCLKNVFVSYRLMFGPRPKAADFIAEVFPPTLEVLGMLMSQRVENEEPEDEWETQDYINCFECLLLEKDLSTLPRLRTIAHPDNLQILEPLVQMAMDRGVHVALTQADLGSLPF